MAQNAVVQDRQGASVLVTDISGEALVGDLVELEADVIDRVAAVTSGLYDSTVVVKSELVFKAVPKGRLVEGHVGLEQFEVQRHEEAVSIRGGDGLVDGIVRSVSCKTGKTLYWSPEEGKWLNMMKQKGGGFLALSTLESKYRKTYGQSGADAIKNSMEVEYRSRMPKLSPEAQEGIRKEMDNLPKGSEEITPAVADQAIASAQNILAVLTSEGYTTRDILGMCKALERSRGGLTNNLAKLSELDENIALEKRKLEEAPDEATKDEIAKRLRDLQDERASRLEAVSSTRGALRSQFSRIRETLHRILHEDKTLAERIKTLFREQGITIASVLTAIGMIISTIVLAIPGGSGGGAAPPQPPGKGGAKGWIKKQLQSLGRILAKLAGKAAAALPGIIGSIVSWLLSLLGKTAVWLAGNLWAVLLAVGGLLLVAARKWLLPKKPKQS